MIGICDNCNKEYRVRHIEEYKRNTNHYCSRSCYDEAKRKSFLNNFNNMQQGYYKIVEYRDKNNVIIQCSICGDITTAVINNLTQHKKPCRKCIDNKKRLKSLRKAIINYELKAIQHKQEQLDSLTIRFNKAMNKIEIHNRAIINKKAREKRKELKREARIKNNGIIDKDITLEQLYIRDKGICYLCNDKCNYDDYKITNEGYFIAGLRYPSIDHIIPLSKGRNAHLGKY